MVDQAAVQEQMDLSRHQWQVAQAQPAKAIMVELLPE